MFILSPRYEAGEMISVVLDAASIVDVLALVDR